jgi:hypothetical protein
LGCGARGFAGWAAPAPGSGLGSLPTPATDNGSCRMIPAPAIDLATSATVARAPTRLLQGKAARRPAGNSRRPIPASRWWRPRSPGRCG